MPEEPTEEQLEEAIQEPIIKLDGKGEASIISYNVPEPTSYSGKNIIELDFDKIEFTEAALVRPDRVPTGQQSQEQVEDAVDEIIETGTVTQEIFPNIVISVESKPDILDQITDPSRIDQDNDAITTDR